MDTIESCILPGRTKLKIKVRLFAHYRERLGQGDLEVELANGATVASLLQRLKEAYPTLPLNQKGLLVAVNKEYAEPSHLLKEGDEVALIPPVSGGSLIIEVTDKPLHAPALVERLKQPRHGAVLTFCGVVRGESEGRPVLALEYEAYREMAEQKLREVAQEIQARWKLEDIALCHRLGHLGVGEVALVIVIAAPHSKEAFAACQYALEQLKRVVPIWKKEIYTDSATWVGQPQG